MSQKWTPELTARLAEKYGFERVTADTGGHVWRLLCSYCDNSDDFEFGPTISITEELVPTARLRGWIIEGSNQMTVMRVHCPTCLSLTSKGSRMRHQKFRAQGPSQNLITDTPGLATQEKAVQALQDFGITPGERGGAACWNVECSCGATDHVGQEYNPDLRTWYTTVRKKFTRIHWDINFNKPPRCPTCTRADRGDQYFPRRDDRIIEGEVSAPLSLPAPTTALGAALVAAAMKVGPAPLTTPVTTIGANAKTIVVVKLLGKHFDEDRGLYEPGWDDERVAGASDSQTAFVEAVRREHCGELAEPPEVTAMRRQIEAFEARHSEEGQALAAMKEQLSNLSLKKRKRLTIEEEARALTLQRLKAITGQS